VLTGWAVVEWKACNNGIWRPVGLRAGEDGREDSQHKLGRELAFVDRSFPGDNPNRAPGVGKSARSNCELPA
jgi:hypothetical protein